MLAAEKATHEGVAVHLGGGFHHAFPDHGEGFCLLNDVAVAAGDVLASGRAQRVVIVDLDVHHGNGTAAIFASDPRVFTFSMHQQNNYPAEKPPSDDDVGLPDRTGDDRYLQLLAEHLVRILDGHRPDLAFYLAGADPYREDQLGGLSLTRAGLRTRDRMVLHECRARGVPVAVTLAGGYARMTADTVQIHVATVEEAAASRRGAP
jgi:acetoin utilization deacetylase AcuC-like enzyme